jgi:hypothetical protein
MILEVLRKDLRCKQEDVLEMNIVAAFNHLQWINDCVMVENEEARLNKNVTK